MTEQNNNNNNKDICMNETSVDKKEKRRIHQPLPFPLTLRIFVITPLFLLFSFSTLNLVIKRHWRWYINSNM